MEIKEMIRLAREAQREFQARHNQESVDRICHAAAKVIYDHAEVLARESVDETGMGVYEDKVAKCKGKSKGVWYNLKGKKSVGIINIDDLTGMIEVAKPIGVVGSITPTTNPVVTPMSNIIFALKTCNAIIVAPHPRSKRCSAHAVRLIKEAIAPFGVPDAMIQIIEEPSIEKTQELMKSVDVVVATGGMDMVRSAYSSGKPSFGVGAGNVQVIVDRNIDYNEAAKKIIAGRTFDNGIICSGEQSVIYHQADKEEVFAAFRAHGAYFCSEAEGDLIRQAIFTDGHLAKDIVGQSVQFIAKKAGVNIPEGTRVIMVEARGIGAEDVICKEKMCPVMCTLPYEHFEQGVEIARANLANEGNGHTAAIHSNNQAHIILAGSELTVSRIVVNAPSATTAGGHIRNGLAVTNTLGCGTWGNNSISENFTYKHLLNISRIAPLSDKIVEPTEEEMWRV
ncbi:aldehyde dehydrogenase family protein [Porphyromonas sp. COT-239 OH1446]|uniref:aldehyde dehydrogenase family protein n=1 Tax=Porphyromonas sp. COT-239 OH1446 TaxID=1515613 RepID=UPI00052B6095|nr:aldehyde dehydrogenase family protein [Porphyromonas sp. COT-239 OH1446]KGN69341.1 succinate-semialdehyde dehydrogenase [Porphyromonas sp. COT-239 OH1446]